MTTRFVLDQSHAILSRPGFNAADGGIAETDKIFDSNWLFGNQVLASGVFDDGVDDIHTTQFCHVVIPDFGFQPALILRQWGDGNFPGHHYEGMKFYRNVFEFNRTIPPQFISNTVFRMTRGGPTSQGNYYGVGRHYWMAIAL